MTGRADLNPGHVNRGGGPKNRLIKIDSQVYAEVGALLRPGPTPPPATAEEVKNVAENIKIKIPKTAKPAKTTGPPGKTTVGTGMAKLVIGGAFLRITQNLVSLVDLFEFLLRLGIFFVDIRVILPGQPAVGLFYLFFTGAPGHTQNLIIISFGHGLFYSLSWHTR